MRVIFVITLLFGLFGTYLSQYLLLFGLFGIYLSQYLNQYQEAYILWTKEIVYHKNPIDEKERQSNIKSQLTKEEIELSCKIESLSGSICLIADVLCLILTCVSITLLIFIGINCYNWNITKINNFDSCELNLLGSVILALTLYLSLPIILYCSHVNLLHPKKTSQIDMKIFDVWYEHQCFQHKHDLFKFKFKPNRLYEILAEKLAKGETTYDEKEINVSDEMKGRLMEEFPQ